jgi:hypothetical protein
MSSAVGEENVSQWHREREAGRQCRLKWLILKAFDLRQYGVGDACWSEAGHILGRPVCWAEAGVHSPLYLEGQKRRLRLSLRYEFTNEPFLLFGDIFRHGIVAFLDFSCGASTKPFAFSRRRCS